ncbi:MAG: glycoside hydrolase family 3 C-terminal domain-containing protein [Anaerolineae bacterium]|jgi:beta-N-acetylhexosaminidase|nr:glycoside hydrolase family 3 C-terminal domain-containing protein [Anaerolineae bacterium]
MQQFMHSFDGSQAPADILAAVEQGEIGAFCLFAHWNVDSIAQLRALNESLARAAARGGQLPPLIGIDQEGGQLVAIGHPATELPGNMALGATRSPQLAEQAGRVLGRELLALGLNMDFAPSLDVNLNPASQAVGVRSFGADPLLVAKLGTAMIRGIQAEGVIAVVKHFPGHGATESDTHHVAAVVPHPLERMNQIELVPFQAAIQAGVPAIMTTHVIFAALDAERPATVSPAILDGYLRREMGFRGTIITDAMDMYAVARLGAETSIQMALEAGADLIVLAHLPDQLELNRRLRDRARPDALARIDALRAAVPHELPPLDVVGCAEHQEIAQTIADQSITLVRDGGHVPLRLRPDQTVAVITPQAQNLTPADTSSSVQIALADAIRQRHPRTQAFQLPRQAAEADIRAILAASASADCVVIGTIVADHDESQAALVRAVHRRGQPLIVVALRTPYDIGAFPEIDTYLCAYGIRAVSTEAVARVLFGEIEAVGVLPCPIPALA